MRAWRREEEKRRRGGEEEERRRRGGPAKPTTHGLLPTAYIPILEQ